MVLKRAALALGALAAIFAFGPACAQAPEGAAAAPAMTAASPQGDIITRDRRLRIEINGKTFDLEARVYRPRGPGPFPLVVINHGTPVNGSAIKTSKLGYAKGATWFARQGFIALVANRPGFGQSSGPFMEPNGPCNKRNYHSDGRETAIVESAIVENAVHQLQGVDPNRIVVLGHSAGGFGAIALGDQPPPGVLGVISFAGGRGGGHDGICSGEEKLIDAARDFGRGNRVPQLWLWSSNDTFFTPTLGHAMFDAYQAGSRPKMAIVDLPPFGKSGHYLFPGGDPAVYAAPVLAFLRQIGVAPGS